MPSSARCENLSMTARRSSSLCASEGAKRPTSSWASRFCAGWQTELKDEVRLERAPAMEGRSLSMVLIPSLQKGEEQKLQRAPSNRNQGEKSGNNDAGDSQPEQVEELADAKT